MADNKLAGLNQAESRDADTLNGGQGVDTTNGGQGSDTIFGGQGDGASLGATSSADSLNGGQGSDSLSGGQADGATADERRDAEAEDRVKDGFTADPTAPTVGEGKADAADTISTRKPDTEAPPAFEPVEPPIPPVGSDAYTDVPGSTPHVLNATPGADPSVPPNFETQRTGPLADTVYRAPSMTRGSAINNIEVRYGELVALLHDFDHDTTGLPADLVALVDFVKSRSAPRA